jgi:LemA protein
MSSPVRFILVWLLVVAAAPRGSGNTTTSKQAHKPTTKRTNRTSFVEGGKTASKLLLRQPLSETALFRQIAKTSGLVRFLFAEPVQQDRARCDRHRRDCMPGAEKFPTQAQAAFGFAEYNTVRSKPIWPTSERLSIMFGSILITVLVIVAIIAVPIVFGIFIYNGLVNKKVETENSWSQIDVQLKRRYDLIPNLVETVKGYAAHEKETLERVIQARNQAMNAKGVAEHAQAENALSGTLKTLFAVAEAYPDLKANQNFMNLQEELTATENRIGFARQHYNDVVGQYNSALMRFPANMIGGMFGFKSAEFFQLSAEEKAAVAQPPQVKF